MCVVFVKCGCVYLCVCGCVSVCVSVCVSLTLGRRCHVIPYLLCVCVSSHPVCFMAAYVCVKWQTACVYLYHSFRHLDWHLDLFGCVCACAHVCVCACVCVCLCVCVFVLYTQKSH